MIFWIAAGGIGVAVAALLLLALLRAPAAGPSGAAQDMRVYRDQLREVERDQQRGTVSAADAARLRTDIARRVLDADRALAAGISPTEAPPAATAVMAVAVALAVLGAVWFYATRLGAPGYPDQPIAERIALADEVHRTRPGQAAAEADVRPAADPAAAPAADPSFLELMDKLRAAVRDRPDDLQGQQLLATNEAGLGNYDAASAAQQRVIALKGPQVTADDHARLAELMILAAGGYVSPEAETELTRALQLDAANPVATYYAGLMFLQTGRPDRSFALWAPLLARSAPGDPWVAPLRAQMVQVAEAAGQPNYTLPDAAPGPAAADVAAAAEMTPEARADMIRGMVGQLAERLATQGGPPADWARLIGSYGVLGETDRARAIWTEAQGRFAADPAAMATLRAAATAAGVAQ